MPLVRQFRADAGLLAAAPILGLLWAYVDDGGKVTTDATALANGISVADDYQRLLDACGFNRGFGARRRNARGLAIHFSEMRGPRRVAESCRFILSSELD